VLHRHQHFRSRRNPAQPAGRLERGQHRSKCWRLKADMLIRAVGP
jgi:hypothetical protein